MLVGVIGLVLWLLSGSISYAVDIQYELSTTHVSGVSDTPLSSVPGYGLVTLVGSTASQITWPVPSGCDAGQGQPQFTRITNPGGVTVGGGGMAVRTDLQFFHTTSTLLPGCHPVASWGQLKRIMDSAIIAAAATEDVVIALGPFNTWFLSACISVDGQGDLQWSTNASCLAWQADMDVINQRYPSRSQGAAKAAEMEILVNDAYAMKTAQGW